jgi:hypothetical protein
MIVQACRVESPVFRPTVQTTSGRRYPDPVALPEEAIGEVENRAHESRVSFCALLNVSAVLTPCSPTGWHRESGKASWGSHLTIRFLKGCVTRYNSTRGARNDTFATKMTSGSLYMSYVC